MSDTTDKELEKIWDDGYSCHKAILVQGNRIDEREFRAISIADAKKKLEALIAQSNRELLERVKLGAVQTHKYSTSFVDQQTKIRPDIQAVPLSYIEDLGKELG